VAGVLPNCGVRVQVAEYFPTARRNSQFALPVGGDESD